MKKIIIFVLTMMLIASMAVPAYAVTPALKIPNMPQISSIKFNTKLEDAVAHAAAEAVKKIDFSKIDFSKLTFNFGG